WTEDGGSGRGAAWPGRTRRTWWWRLWRHWRRWWSRRRWRSWRWRLWWWRWRLWRRPWIQHRPQVQPDDRRAGPESLQPDSVWHAGGPAQQLTLRSADFARRQRWIWQRRGRWWRRRQLGSSDHPAGELQLLTVPTNTKSAAIKG